MDYEASIIEESKRRIARVALFYLSVFLGCLRGEEVPRVVRKYFILLKIKSQGRILYLIGCYLCMDDSRVREE